MRVNRAFRVGDRVRIVAVQHDSDSELYTDMANIVNSGTRSNLIDHIRDRDVFTVRAITTPRHSGFNVGHLLQPLRYHSNGFCDIAYGREELKRV